MTEDLQHQGGRIVVGVDGSAPSNQAVEWAAKQAALTGSALVLVAAWHVPAMAYGSLVPVPQDLDLAGATRDLVDQVADAVEKQHPGLDVVRRVTEGQPALVLVEESEGANLLVVGSRGHGAFAGMLLGSVSEYCVTHATIPVVVVHHGGEA